MAWALLSLAAAPGSTLDSALTQLRACVPLTLSPPLFAAVMAAYVHLVADRMVRFVSYLYE
jgi:hypothetical protein